jgi:NAD(P)-dependent dehydrogenase (short-subunit alcohol dehydrogenase family)
MKEVNVMGKLSGKVAVITGGNSGIGFATAKRFVEEGAQVVITGRRKKELDDAAAAIGRNITAVQGDVSRLEDLNRLYAIVRDKHRHIDVLFANAGVGSLAPLGSITEEHFDREFDINVKGVLFTVQRALPLITDGGSIILNSSIAGQKGIGGFSIYNATKAAVRSFARTWTSDLKERKIRVNAISPGPIETPIFGKMGLTKEQVDQFAGSLASQVPMGRVGRAEEIASAAVFLASDESSFITGIDLNVDGGLAQV